jgi:hypothetical protein
MTFVCLFRYREGVWGERAKIDGTLVRVGHPQLRDASSSSGTKNDFISSKYEKRKKDLKTSFLHKLNWSKRFIRAKKNLPLPNHYNCKRVMIICSKFDCSKNLLDTILLLLDTVRAIIFFLVNCSKIKNHEKSSAIRVFRAVSLLDKKISTVRKSNARQRWWKMSTARHNL